MEWARRRPCEVTGGKYGRWRPVGLRRLTNSKQDCFGGGVPMDVGVTFYADSDSGYDFDHNLDFAESETRPENESEREFRMRMEKMRKAVAEAGQGHE